MTKRTRKNSFGKTNSKQGKAILPNVKLHKLDWLEWTAIVISFWFWIVPIYYEIIFAIVLSIPLIGLILNGISRPSLASLVSISNKPGEKAYDLADFIEIPGLVILIRVLSDFEFESFYSILKVGTVAFIILLLLLVATHRLVENKNKNKWLIYMAVVGNIALYSYGATYGVNCVYDNSEPKIYQAKVIDKSIYRGRKSRTTYYLKVEPWGHHHDAERISVERYQYMDAEIGKTVSIAYKQGLLGIPWYRVE
jgi:hypothetical protein